MAVLKQHRTNMPQEAYNRAADQVHQSQREADGFISHYAVFKEDGLTVFEIWESTAQHDAWWEKNMTGVVPADLPKPEFHEIHRTNHK